MFGYAFGAFGGGSSDDRLPVGYLDLDGSSLSKRLHGLLAASQSRPPGRGPGAPRPTWTGWWWTTSCPPPSSSRPDTAKQCCPAKPPGSP